VCGDRFIQGTALKQHQRMQGHSEGSQPSPYASISVNNPSRFTNSNLVNRRYMEQQAQQQQSQNSQMPIKPVIPRRRAPNSQLSTNVNPVQNQMIQQTTSSMINQPQMNQEHRTNDINRTPSPNSQHHHAESPPNSASQDIKPNLQNLNLPQYNGSMPLVTNIPNMEIATLFTMSFNQNNFQNHSN